MICHQTCQGRNRQFRLQESSMLKLMFAGRLAMWPDKTRFDTYRGPAYGNFVGRLRRLFE